MTTELARAEQRPAGRAIIVADALTQEAEQRKLLGQYVQQHMVEGTDYGVIPGTKNRTLLKAGAEKLTQLFRCVPEFAIEEKIEDWGTGLFFYRFSCRVVTQADGAVVAEGVGSCSTYESRYRWRTADRACPECGKAAIMRSKFAPRDDPDAEPGWFCFAKKGGCGANFDAGDEAVTSQRTGRVENPDLHDCANTVLKMAKKRALVDAAIALARCSDIFTQDLEDVAGEAPTRPTGPEPSEDDGRPAPAKALPPKAEQPRGGQHTSPPPEADPYASRLADLKAHCEAAGYSDRWKQWWGKQMGWLGDTYPQDRARYTADTRPRDVELPRLDHLLRHLNTLSLQPKGA